MANKVNKVQPLTILIDSSELSPSQCRLIRSLNAHLSNLLSTDDESEFFEGSAEVMRLCASVIKQASFIEDPTLNDNIPYADQALEYSIETLTEHIESKKIIHFDN